MKFINDYKNHGGKVGAGEDAGYIYETYGFGYIQELELLREVIEVLLQKEPGHRFPDAGSTADVLEGIAARG